MRWYINELSLQGQFKTGEVFLTDFLKVASVHWKLKGKMPQLFCTHQLQYRPVTTGMNASEAVRRSKPDIRKLLFGWISKNGPFVEDDRQEEPDDYFEFEGEDVTDSGLGEAARRVRVDDPSGVFSFTGGRINFERTPLTVSHGLTEDPLGALNIPNIWDVQELESCLNERRAPQSWEELIKSCKERFNHLEISNDILKTTLAREPFNRVVAENIERRLDVLQEIMSGRRVSNGEMTGAANKLWKEHSQGGKALFSDESETNKRRFEQELTFKDPSDSSKSVFCPWHGKISHKTFRIHFEWPVPPGQTQLKVVYIGRKITRQ